MKQHLKKLKTVLLELNLYPSETEDKKTIRQERLATRLLISLLILSLISITLISGLIIRTIHVTEQSPSSARFRWLVQHYPQTLQCPCSRVGISFDEFVSIATRFHQVCSSQLISSSWIQALFDQALRNGTIIDNLNAIMSFFWQNMADYCQTGVNIWSNVLTRFHATPIFSPQALSENVLRVEAQQTIENQIQSAKTTISRNLFAIQKTIAGNQFVSALGTNFYLGYLSQYRNSWTAPKMLSKRFSNCSCTNIDGCPQSVLVNLNASQRTLKIPGLVIDCYPVDGVLQSTLECYYDQNCFEILHPQSTNKNLTLSRSSDKKSLSNETIQTLLHRLMVDHYEINVNFDSFYSKCQAEYCYYSFQRRFDIMFMLTTVLSIFGGLFIVLKYFSLFLTNHCLSRKSAEATTTPKMSHVNGQSKGEIIVYFQFFTYQIHSYFISANKASSRMDRLKQTVRGKLVEINPIHKQDQQSSSSVRKEQLTDILFYTILALLLILIALYLVLVDQSQLITVSKPSEDVYRHLNLKYSQTLSCSCSNAVQEYRSLIKVNYSFHGICSSSMISTEWLNYIRQFDPIDLPAWTHISFLRDYRTYGLIYFQFLSTFCLMAKQNVLDAQETFGSKLFINNYILTPEVYEQQLQSIIDTFLVTTKDNFNRILKSVIIANLIDVFMSGTNINFRITVKNGSVDVSDISYPTGVLITTTSISIVGACVCGTTYPACYISTYLYENVTTFTQYSYQFQELQHQCIALPGFLESLNTWWYDANITKMIQNTYNVIIGSNTSVSIHALDATKPGRFFNRTLNYVIDEMFLENISTIKSSFKAFYSQCAPTSCTYSTVDRRNLILALLLILSIYGSLKIGLRIFAPILTRILIYCIEKCRNRGNLFGRITLYDLKSKQLQITK